VENTYVIKGKPISQWYLIDARNRKLGHLATKVAALLLGKHKPTYTPGVMMGDSVVVINAKHLQIDQSHLDSKMYYRHSGYPSGIKSIVMRELMKVHPERVIRAAVWGMLPHNKIGRQLIKRLYVYQGGHHPHHGQKPQLMDE